MAPFKLKFRKNGSRGPSQEEYDPQVNEALLPAASSEQMGASSSTIDSTDCTSLGNERKQLLPNKNNDMRLGYLNPSEVIQSDSHLVPKTPPPSYEHVLEENNRLANCLDLEMGSRLTLSADEDHLQGEHQLNSNSQSNISYSTFEPTTSANSCTDPNCNHNEDGDDDGGGLADSSDEFQNVDESKETLNSSECLLNDMTSTSTINQQEESSIDENDDRPLDCDSAPPEYSSENNENDISTTLSNEEEDESENDCTYSTYSEHYTLPDQQGFISNKSTKKMYKAVAKEWGITCKMSDQCRCLDCQSNYFGCDYDYTEQNSDGGLGAVNAVFINEVMHGSACTIL